MYEIIVVGGGHAGCEAAHASAVKKHKTLLITGNIKNITGLERPNIEEIVLFLVKSAKKREKI